MATNEFAHEVEVSMEILACTMVVGVETMSEVEFLSGVLVWLQARVEGGRGFDMRSPQAIGYTHQK